MAALAAAVPVTADSVIIGGDFNVITRRGVQELAGIQAAGALRLQTAFLNPTLSRFDRPLARADHIVTRGFVAVAGGGLPDVAASDHFPVWVRLR